eukprot:g12939.t1 g12939   contig7:502860-504380(+)
MNWRDDQYLFRLASTFGWDEAITLCNSLITGIELTVDASRRQQRDTGNMEDGRFNDSLDNSAQAHQKTPQEWLNYAFNQLLYQDQWKNTPLHAACYVKPPVDVIDALLRIGRVLWKHRSYLLHVPVFATASMDNSTPFLVACSTGASTDVLQRYLDEIEYYIDQKWVDSQWARNMILKPDDQGTSPLFGWMAFHNGWIKRILSTLASIKEIRLVEVQPTLYQSIGDWHVVCCRIAPYCPTSLLDWVAAYQLDGKHVSAVECAATRDSTGRLPLHRALEAADLFRSTTAQVDKRLPMTGCEIDSIDTPKKQSADELDKLSLPVKCHNNMIETNRLQIVEALLQWHPKAATIPFPSGRSPLCQAIAFGSSCHTNGGTGIVQLLLQYAPASPLEPDPITGLYPFMLAATASTVNDEDACCVINTLYLCFVTILNPLRLHYINLTTDNKQHF